MWRGRSEKRMNEMDLCDTTQRSTVQYCDNSTIKCLSEITLCEVKRWRDVDKLMESIRGYKLQQKLLFTRFLFFILFSRSRWSEKQRKKYEIKFTRKRKWCDYQRCEKEFAERSRLFYLSTLSSTSIIYNHQQQSFSARYGYILTQS